jgi:predicted Zn finger-like uncharacterized protein
MLITCPNCKKRFEMDPESVRESKKLRCSSCRAVFRLVRKPQPQTPASPVEEPAAGAPGTPAPGTVAPPAAREAQVAAEGERELLNQPAAAPAAVQPPVEPAQPQAASGRLRVVVANESIPFCEAVQKILSTEPFDVVTCNDGKVALETVQRLKPEVLLLDVALPTMFGFEVCERVRQDAALASVKIVLIAAIYDKTRYKRSPNSLYGADDYIEKHHIPDSLIPMIYRLASASVPVAESPSEQELAAQEESREEIRQVEVAETSAATAAPEELAFSAAAAAAAAAPEALPLSAAAAAPEVPFVAPEPAAAAPEATPAPAQLSEAETKAKRLARIIVSDIVLYNQAKVEQGVRDGKFFDLLADDIREGERLYKQRVSQEVRDNSSFLSDAFNEVIAKKRAELRI